MTAAIVFATWFIASVVCQLKWLKLGRILKRYDYCSILPSWTFFAPNPGMTDFQILYRDRLINEVITPWASLKDVNHLAWSVWHPSKRQRKALSDLCQNIMRLARRNGIEERLVISMPYLALLSFVTQRPRPPFSKQRQFLIAKTQRETVGDPDILFVSHFHDL
jgi:hypothetical protein